MTTIAERASTPPTRRQGLVLAIIAVVMMLGGTIGTSLLLAQPGFAEPDGSDQLELIRLLLVGSIVDTLGFIPLLFAVLALLGRRAHPAWLVPAAIGVLLVRPVALAIELVSAPIAVFTGPAPLLLFLSTSVAAGLVAIAVLPPTGTARRPERIAVVGIGVALLTGLALFGFSPYAAPVAAIGVAVALAFPPARGPIPDADADADNIDELGDVDEPSDNATDSDRDTAFDSNDGGDGNDAEPRGDRR